MHSSLQIVLFVVFAAGAVIADFTTDLCGAYPVFPTTITADSYSTDGQGFGVSIPGDVLAAQSCGTTDPTAYDSDACAVGDGQFSGFCSRTQQTLGGINAAVGECANVTQLLSLVDVVHQQCGVGFYGVSAQWKNCQSGDRATFLQQLQGIQDNVASGNQTYIEMAAQLQSEWESGSLCENCALVVVFMYKLVGYMASCLFNKIFSEVFENESSTSVRPADVVNNAYNMATTVLNKTMTYAQNTVPYAQC